MILNKLDVTAEMIGSNDILACGRKISGNAQFSTVRRMFSQGTLLFDSDLEEVVNAVTVKMSKIATEGNKYVRSRVAYIEGVLYIQMNIKDLRQHLLVRHIHHSEYSEYILS